MSANPIVHFEIIGRDPHKLREYYKQLFEWEANTDSEVVPEVSEAGQYGFIGKVSSDDVGSGIPGGIGGGKKFQPQSIFYVGVPDVEVALQKAEALGGKRLLGPAKRPDGGVVVGQFTDPEGNVIGVAGPK